MVLHDFNPSIQRVDLYEIEANLVYILSSRTTKAMEKNPVSEYQKGQNQKKKNSVVVGGRLLVPGYPDWEQASDLQLHSWIKQSYIFKCK